MPEKPSVLFICGSLNQTIMMHKISQQMGDIDSFFTPYYADGLVGVLAKMHMLQATILGGRHRRETMNYINTHQLLPDLRGKRNDYDLVVTCSDLIIQKNIRGKRLVLVQEGMTEPEGLAFQLVKYLRFPRYLANTAATGLSDAYQVFCVASDGYRDLFVKKGVKPSKIAITGIPNFDDLTAVKDADFPYHDYVLVATSPLRETGQFDNRPTFIKHCVKIAAGRQVIFKLHPMEKARRAWREIHRLAPEAKIYRRGDINPMIANASVVITQRSTCTFVAMALGKEVHSYLDLEKVRTLMPIQNGGTSASNIAAVCQQVLQRPLPVTVQLHTWLRPLTEWKIFQG